MIKFKYMPNEGMRELIVDGVVGYSGSMLSGIMSEQDTGRIQSCKLFLMAAYEWSNNNTVCVYRDPLVVVAYRDTDAAEYYSQYKLETTGKKIDAATVCVLEEKAAKANIIT